MLAAQNGDQPACCRVHHAESGNGAKRERIIDSEVVQKTDLKWVQTALRRVFLPLTWCLLLGAISVAGTGLTVLHPHLLQSLRKAINKGIRRRAASWRGHAKAQGASS